jgi:hypothetical protein
LEQRSLFGASEYLALKVLNEVSCTINNDLAAQLESYRAMKTGNTAPDFEFNGDVFAPAYKSGNIPEKLSDLKSNYTVVYLVQAGVRNVLRSFHRLPGYTKNGKNTT